MKLALAFVCFILILIGVFDLEPYRPRRPGRVQHLRRFPRARRQVR